jgi:hypothetical protein
LRVSASLRLVTQTGELLTTAQTAELLGKDVATVNRYAAEGRLPAAHKLPGRTGANLFSPDTVDAFKRERGQAS